MGRSLGSRSIAAGFDLVFESRTTPSSARSFFNSSIALPRCLPLLFALAVSPALLLLAGGQTMAQFFGFQHVEMRPFEGPTNFADRLGARIRQIEAGSFVCFDENAWAALEWIEWEDNQLESVEDTFNDNDKPLNLVEQHAFNALHVQLALDEIAISGLPPCNVMHTAGHPLDYYRKPEETRIEIGSAKRQGGPSATSNVSVEANVNYANFSSTTTFISPTDTYKIHSNTNQLQLDGRVNFGSWFTHTEAAFAGMPNGSFSDMFPMFPAANFSGSVNSGSVYSFTGDGGYNFFQGPGWQAGAFVGYYSLTENLTGMIAGGTGLFSALQDHVEALRIGGEIKKAFLEGKDAIVFRGSIAGMPYVDFQSGALNAHGRGVQANLMLSFPVPNTPLRGNVSVQESYMTTSGASLGVPMTAKNNNFTVGAGLTYSTEDTLPVCCSATR